MNLYKHQIQTIKAMAEKKRLACWLDMGLGKTLCALKAIHEIGEKALIVCPNYLKRTWLNEIRKWYPQTRATMIDGDKVTRAFQIKESSPQIKIINYESFRIEEAEILRWIIKTHGFKILVCDESQSLKSRSSQQTKAALRLSNNFDYRWLLSGTPVTNDFSDYYSQYKMLLPQEFKTFSDFKGRYLKMGGYMNYKVVGHRNEDEFKRITDPWTIRLKKEDCIDLPPKIYQTVYTEMTDTQAAAYRQMKRDSVIMLDQTEPSAVATVAAVRLMRLRQIASGGWCGNIKEDGSKEVITIEPNPPKITTLIEMVLDNINDHSMIIWTAYRYDIDLISKRLTAAGVVHGVIQGATSADDRQKYIDDFQAKKFKVMIINNSIVAGMTLTAADLVFRYARSYSYANDQQAEDRCHRIGQTKTVTYIDLTARGTVDESLIRILEQKGDLAKIVDKNEWREIFLNGEEM